MALLYSVCLWFIIIFDECMFYVERLMRTVHRNIKKGYTALYNTSSTPFYTVIHTPNSILYFMRYKFFSFLFRIWCDCVVNLNVYENNRKKEFPYSLIEYVMRDCISLGLFRKAFKKFRFHLLFQLFCGF